MQRLDDSNPRALRHRLRRARFARVEALLRAILRDRPVARVIDIGGRPGYWHLLDPALRDRVAVTLLNLPEELEREFPPGPADLDIRMVAGDATAMPEHADGGFDLAHSNSVIEHVGLYSAMARFAAEHRRVGRAYYLQTPNFWFPVEPHYGVPFFHWLPEPVRIGMHQRLNVGFARRTDWEDALARVDHTRMISRAMLRRLFPDGRHATERLALLPKSLIVWRDWPGAGGAGR